FSANDIRLPRFTVRGPSTSFLSEPRKDRGEGGTVNYAPHQDHHRSRLPPANSQRTRRRDGARPHTSTIHTKNRKHDSDHPPRKSACGNASERSGNPQEGVEVPKTESSHGRPTCQKQQVADCLGQRVPRVTEHGTAEQDC